MDTTERIDRLEATVDVLVHDVAELKEDHVSRDDVARVSQPIDLLQARIKLDVAELLLVSDDRQDSKRKAFEDRQDSERKAFEERQNSERRAFEERQNSERKAFEDRIDKKFREFQQQQDLALKTAADTISKQVASELSTKLMRWILGAYSLIVAVAAMLWFR